MKFFTSAKVEAEHIKARLNEPAPLILVLCLFLLLFLAALSIQSQLEHVKQDLRDSYTREWTRELRKDAR